MGIMMKRGATSDLEKGTCKRAKNAQNPFIPEPKQKNLLNIATREWEVANSYFKTPQGEWRARRTKMCKKLHKTNHSFLKFDEEIIALANRNIEKILGEGSFGLVKIGQAESGENCAIKIEAGKKREESVEEVKVMKRLKYHLGETSRTFNKEKEFKGEQTKSKRYTALKLCKGEELEALLKGKDHLSYTQKLIIAIKASEALLEAHKLRVIHADIKAKNMVTDVNANEITVELVDFDFSMLLPEHREHMYDGVKGTKGYMAPEIKEDKVFSFYTDIFALGAMFKKDLGLPDFLYEHMLHDEPKKRCSLIETIMNLINELSKQPHLDIATLEFIEMMKLKYESKKVLLTGFSYYMQQTVNTLTEIPKMASDYFKYYFKP